MQTRTFLFPLLPRQTLSSSSSSSGRCPPPSSSSRRLRPPSASGRRPPPSTSRAGPLPSSIRIGPPPSSLCPCLSASPASSRRPPPSALARPPPSTSRAGPPPSSLRPYSSTSPASSRRPPPSRSRVRPPPSSLRIGPPPSSLRPCSSASPPPSALARPLTSALPSPPHSGSPGPCSSSEKLGPHSSPPTPTSPRCSAPPNSYLTPDGRADALAPHLRLHRPGAKCVASAHVRQVDFSTAVRLVKGSDSGSGLVAYAQQQYDCLRGEYTAIAGDVDAHVPWATEALGCLPVAINLWIGSAYSQTSFHKDHYDNIYVVVFGQKHFLLLPPPSFVFPPPRVK
ncbi:hypothetical protein ABZP36_002856 [Zizania latifolia]